MSIRELLERQERDERHEELQRMRHMETLERIRLGELEPAGGGFRVNRKPELDL